MLCFTAETGVRGRISPKFCEVGSYPEGCAGGGCYSIFPTSRQSQTMEKKEKAGGRKKWENKPKEMRGLAAPRPEHQSLVPPLGLCSQPRLCGVRAGLQRCRDVFVGWEGAFTEHPASSSPLQELPPLVSSLKSGTSVFSCFFPCFSAQVNLQFADFRAVPSPARLTGHDAACETQPGKSLSLP